MFDWASTLHIQFIIHTAILQLPLQIVHQLSPPIKLLQTLALFPQTVYCLRSRPVSPNVVRPSVRSFVATLKIK